MDISPELLQQYIKIVDKKTETLYNSIKITEQEISEIRAIQAKVFILNHIALDKKRNKCNSKRN